MTSHLMTDLDDGVLWLRLNRPEAFNALSGELVLALHGALRAASTDDDVAVVVLTGEGDAFCAGAELTGERPQEQYDAASVDAANALIRAVLQCDKPVVCGLNGIAAGVGMSLVLACDLVAARESAALTLGFTKVGLMPDGGASHLLAASVGRVTAMRLALTSEVIAATEAYAHGLVTHLLEDDGFDSELRSVVAVLVDGPPLALTATKRAVNAATLAGLEDAFARERAGQAVLLRTEDAGEGMRAFLERRRPQFRGR